MKSASQSHKLRQLNLIVTENRKRGIRINLIPPIIG